MDELYTLFSPTSSSSRLIHLSDNEEEVPLVRSAAIQQLTELAKLIGPEIKPELGPLLAG